MDNYRGNEMTNGNAIALVVINDGNGSICGYSYETRCKFARQDTLANSSKWNTMAKNAAMKEGYIDC